MIKVLNRLFSHLLITSLRILLRVIWPSPSPQSSAESKLFSQNTESGLLSLSEVVRFRRSSYLEERRRRRGRMRGSRRREGEGEGYEEGEEEGEEEGRVCVSIVSSAQSSHYVCARLFKWFTAVTSDTVHVHVHRTPYTVHHSFLSILSLFVLFSLYEPLPLSLANRITVPSLLEPHAERDAFTLKGRKEEGGRRKYV